MALNALATRNQENLQQNALTYWTFTEGPQHQDDVEFLDILTVNYQNLFRFDEGPDGQTAVHEMIGHDIKMSSSNPVYSAQLTRTTNIHQPFPCMVSNSKDDHPSRATLIRNRVPNTLP